MPDRPDKKRNLPLLLILVLLLLLGGYLLARAIFGSKDCKCGGNADYKNLGYEPMEIWTVPSPILWDTPFEVHWKICYQEHPCEGLVAGASTEYTEVLTSTVYDPDPTVLLTESFPRDPLAAGDCDERMYVHPGVVQDLVEIEIEWRDPGLRSDNDCEGKRKDVDVFENNKIALQAPVACSCEEQKYYDIKVAVGPTYDASERQLVWIVQFDCEPCEAGPRVKEIAERFELKRKSSGEVVATRDESFPLLMGDSINRIFKLTDWVVDERYVATVRLGGPDCHPTLTNLHENNGGVLEFTVEF
jgi:hypothetical protein